MQIQKEMRMDIWYLFQWYLLEYSLETQRLPDITFMEYGKTHRIYQFLFDIIHSHKGGERGTETHSWFRHAQTASTINLLWYKPYCVTPLLRTATGFLFYSEQKAWMIYFPFASWNCLLSLHCVVCLASLALLLGWQACLPAVSILWHLPFPLLVMFFSKMYVRLAS